jgi:hypothetical protein
MKRKEYKTFVYSLLYIQNLYDYARNLVTEYTPNEYRNRKEYFPIVFKKLLFGGYFEIFNHGKLVYKDMIHPSESGAESTPYKLDEVRRDDYIYRFNGCNLGTKRFPDYRQIMGVVKVDHVSQKYIIGTCGERVRPEQIICVCREGIERSETK